MFSCTAGARQTLRFLPKTWTHQDYQFWPFFVGCRSSFAIRYKSHPITPFSDPTTNSLLAFRYPYLCLDLSSLLPRLQQFRGRLRVTQRVLHAKLKRLQNQREDPLDDNPDIPSLWLTGVSLALAASLSYFHHTFDPYSHSSTKHYSRPVCAIVSSAGLQS